jgi:hypothetical protein
LWLQGPSINKKVLDRINSVSNISRTPLINLKDRKKFQGKTLSKDRAAIGAENLSTNEILLDDRNFRGYHEPIKNKKILVKTEVSNIFRGPYKNFDTAVGDYITDGPQFSTIDADKYSRNPVLLNRTYANQFYVKKEYGLEKPSLQGSKKKISHLIEELGIGDTTHDNDKDFFIANELQKGIFNQKLYCGSSKSQSQSSKNDYKAFKFFKKSYDPKGQAKKSQDADGMGSANRELLNQENKEIIEEPGPNIEPRPDFSINQQRNRKRYLGRDRGNKNAKSSE